MVMHTTLAPKKRSMQKSDMNVKRSLYSWKEWHLLRTAPLYDSNPNCEECLVCFQYEYKSWFKHNPPPNFCQPRTPHAIATRMSHIWYHASSSSVAIGCTKLGTVYCCSRIKRDASHAEYGSESHSTREKGSSTRRVQHVCPGLPWLHPPFGD